MRKMCLILLVCLLIPLLCGCNDEPPVKTVYLLSEEVVTVTNLIDGQTHTGEVSKIQYSYDGKGLLTKIHAKYVPGYGDTATTEFENDENGRVVHKTIRDEKGRITEDWRYTYDAAGRVLTEDKSTTVKHVFTVTWTYDDKGRPLSAITTYHGDSAEPFPNDQTLYTYDDDARTSTISKYRYDKLASRQVFLLDENGKTAEESYYTVRNEVLELLYRMEYEYTDTVTKIHRFSPNGDLSSTRTKTYDAQGNLLREETKNSEGTVTGSATYTYDEQGKLIRKEEPDRFRTSTTTTTYTYIAVQIPDNSSKS